MVSLRVFHIKACDPQITLAAFRNLIFRLLVHQAVNNIRHVADRDRVSHAFHRASGKLLGIDADHFPFYIKQRAAAVSLIDGRVCLDHTDSLSDSLAGRLVFRSGHTIQGADHAGRYGLSVAQRVPDGNSRFPYLKLCGIPQCSDRDVLHRFCRNLILAYCDHRHIMLRIAALDVSLRAGFVRKRNSQCLAALDHMIVGHDQKLLVCLADDDPCPRALHLILLYSAEKVLYLLDTQVRDRYDRRHHTLYNRRNVGGHDRGRFGEGVRHWGCCFCFTLC